MKNAAFIMGSERSGTNLLRILLDNHKDICAPVSPHFLDAFKIISPYYGDLSKNSGELINDLISLANHPFNDWKLEIQDLDAVQNIQSFMAAYDFIYDQKAKSEGKSNYISKDIHLYQHIELIEKYYSQAKFIYLTRDVRDHVASWLKSPIYLNSPQKIANKWKREQIEMMRLECENKDRVMRIKYEDLIADSKGVMTDLMNFLKVDIDENCFTTSKKERPEANRNQLWKNLSKPIDSSNKSKYRNALKKKDIKLIESIAKNEMIALGYSLDYSGEYKRHPKIEALEEFMWTRKARKIQKEKMSDDLTLLKDKQKLIRGIKERLISDYKYYY